MLRRSFLRRAGTAVLGALSAGGPARRAAAAESGPSVETVLGPVPAAELGPTLPHEHVLVDFVGADRVSPSRYDADAVFRAVRPHLEQAQALGIRTLCECTPAWLGRDPRLLARLATATGLRLVTNTGYYGARKNIFLPPHAHTETAAQLAARWIAEARDGIGDTGIRPGFIKSGVDTEPVLSPVHRTLVEAAARTHAATGLTIAVHCGRGPGREILDVLRTQGVAPGAFVWVHAQGARDDDLFAAADAGAWISCDGLNRNSLARHLHLCRELKQRGHLARTLLSHDAGWFDPAKPGGGTFRPFDTLHGAFLPQLREAGFGDDEVTQLLERNPAAALARRVRPA